MGVKTLYEYFYKLAYGDKGADKATLVNDCLDGADAEIKANKDAKHAQNTDTALGTQTQDVNMGSYKINNLLGSKGDSASKFYEINAIECSGADIGAKINSAVTTLGADKGVIRIPAGSFSFSTPIILNDDITLQGAGQLATSLNWTGTNNAEDIITTNGSQLTLRDFGVSVGTGKSARSIIYIQNSRNLHFSNLYLRGELGDDTTTLNGIYADGSTDNNVYYNLFENVKVSHCNECWHLGGSAVTQNTFINCNGSNAGLYGFFGSGHKFVFTGCIFEGNATGIKIYYGGAVLIGCYFEGNTGTDIYLDYPDGSVVQGCRIYNKTSTKDYIIYCAHIQTGYQGIQIRDNIIRNSIGTVTTAIYLCAGANADGNVFNVISGEITNEYNQPVGSRVDGCPVIFPATQIPSNNVNALDDYKEDAWTPALQFGGASVDMTYTAQTGLYTKIGRQVTITCYIVLSAKGTSTGNALITGLPFTCKNDNGAISAVSMRLNVVTFANQYQGSIGANTTNIYLKEITEAGAETYLVDTNFADTSMIILSATYFTD